MKVFFLGCSQTLMLAGALLLTSRMAVAQVAFPGAVGYGATATGGRSGHAVYVTNLNDSGPGSFRAAVSKPGAIVVFSVGGIIRLKSAVAISDNITVAGQTAPGDGIMLYGDKVSVSGENVILRYLRLRGGISESPHASSLNVSDAHRIIVDHLSIEWGRWDDIQAARSSFITIQNSLIGESLDPQRFGCLCESDYMTLTHNLWVDNESRNPKGKGHIQYVNNIVYNWGVSGYVGGHSQEDRYADLQGNYFIEGPSSKNDSFLSMFWPSDHVYQANNMVDLNQNGKLDGRLITDADFASAKATVSTKSVLDSAPLLQVDAPEIAFKKVVANAGDTLCRDSVDARLIRQTLSLGVDGKIIDSEEQVGGAPMLRTGETPKDTDQDGIPDAWEKEHHLDPNDPKDANKIGLLTRMCKGHRFTRLSERRRVGFLWRPAVALSAAGS
ncbi:hypothetical protein ACOBR2_07070 [Telmatobacter bradus]|uniref:hypothetical protein n=1 Tax=Telmatobacter bradus TaxID=474953 RepID=UPI003B43243C